MSEENSKDFLRSTLAQCQLGVVNGKKSESFEMSTHYIVIINFTAN